MQTPKPRRYERHVVTGSTVAVFKSSDKHVRVGLMKDISEGGLLFKYADFTKMPINIKGEIDIHIHDYNFFLADVPCKVVYCNEVPQEDSVFGVTLPEIHCGLQFTELLEEAKRSLKSLLAKLA